MVIVQRRPFLVGHADVLFIIVVVVDHGHVRPKGVLKSAGQRGLARAGAPGNADDHGVHLARSPFVCRFVVIGDILAHAEKNRNHFPARTRSDYHTPPEGKRLHWHRIFLFSCSMLLRPKQVKPFTMMQLISSIHTKLSRRAPIGWKTTSKMF